MRLAPGDSEPQHLRRAEEVAQALISKGKSSTKDIKAYKSNNHMCPKLLNEQQLKAIEAIADHNLVLLSGGPGTGKTSTIIQMIIKIELMI